ncbi:MAG: motility associated factor glycosyltransferase family protein [Planctomycetota bacterium]|jgi:hypothetical protein
MTYLESNLKHLEENNPQLAESCRKWEPLDEALVEAARDGNPVLKAVSDEGEKVYLHSRYDPVKEAEKLIDSYEIGPLDTVFVFGFGFGYHVLELVRRLDAEARIVVLEADGRRFRTALEHMDLSPLLSRECVELVVGSNLMSAFGRLRPQIPAMFGGRIILVSHPPSLRLHSAYYDTARAEFVKFTDASKVILTTMFGLAKTTLANRLSNIADYVFSEKAGEYKDRFKGCPAFIVSAGPSLAKNIEILRSVGNRGLVIAVSTAFKRLISEEIPVHFSVVLDYNRLSKRYFENLPDDIAVPLVADSKANPDAIAVYNGPKIFPEELVLDLILGRPRDGIKEFELGATVAHTAFLFARYAGCDPIVFAGQDLSYSHGITHLPGTAIYRQWLGELNRFNTYESKEWDSLMRLAPILIREKDINGNPVFTDELMISYIADFESHFAETKARILNATEGGLSLNGAENVTLSHVVDNCLGDEIDAGLLRRDAVGGADEAGRKKMLSNACDKLENFMTRAIELEKSFDFMLERLKRIRNRLNKGKDVDALVDEVMSSQKGLEKFGDVMTVITNLVRADLHEKNKADREISSAKLTGSERTLAETERDYTYITAIAGGNRYLRKLLKNSLERIDAFLKEN